MKAQNETIVIKTIERFDKQLLSILSKELNSFKAAKHTLIQTLNLNSKEGVLQT